MRERGLQLYIPKTVIADDWSKRHLDLSNVDQPSIWELVEFIKKPVWRKMCEFLEFYRYQWADFEPNNNR